jgi:hypothetical protein
MSDHYSDIGKLMADCLLLHTCISCLVAQLQENSCGIFDYESQVLAGQGVGDMKKMDFFQN